MKQTDPAVAPDPSGDTLSQVMLASGDAAEASITDIVQRALRAIRAHLGLETAFVSEFVDGRRVFRYVDSGLEAPLLQAGASDPLEESYCQRVVDGRLPGLIRDAGLQRAAQELAVTRALPVGAHLSVPIHLTDGRVYGTLCCFSRTPDQTLVDRDLAMMRVFADFVGGQIERHIERAREEHEVRARVRSMLDQDSFRVVFQPICHVEHKAIVGLEALTRFSALPPRPPDVWFAEAARAGLADRLESAVMAKALRALDALPDGTYLSINASAEAVLSGAARRALEGVDLRKVMLEITEHAPVADYAAFGAALAPLRRLGMRLAVDDAGAGYASFRHILALRPDVIKLDMSLTRDIHKDTARRALAAALIAFAEQTGSTVVAEGVESEEELAVLRALRVTRVQGYLVGRPAPLDDALAKPAAR